MPRRRNYGRSKSRRRRKNYRRKRSVTSTYGGTPLPTAFKTSLRYSEGYTLNPGLTTTALELIGANCLWDPNLNVGGHQPRGWDELISMYNHATVIGSKITCQFSNTDTSNPQIAGVALRPTTVGETDVNNYIEGSHVKYVQLAPAGSGGSQKTISYPFSNKYLNISKPMSSAILRNSVSSNPTEIAVFQPFAASAIGTDTSAVELLVTVEYAVVFTEPKPVTQS